MAGALPLAKLTSLLIKTFAKPLAKQVKHQFSKNPMGQSVLTGIGQANHQLTSRMTIWSSGYRVRSITPLDEKEAMKTGADFIGETVVVGVSAGIVIWEYDRSSRANKEKAKKQRAESQAERDSLQAKLVTLDVRLKALEEVVKSNSESILGFGGKSYKAPTNTVSIQDDNGDIPIAGDLLEADNPPKKKGSWWKFGF